eukprot:m.312367 g.312367  ORF g.312367 m.312367 type:complete len:143 (+) comp255096_c0_seq1:1-429(+)
MLFFSFWWLFSLFEVLVVVSSFSKTNIFSRNPKRTFAFGFLWSLIITGLIIAAVFLSDPLRRGYSTWHSGILNCHPVSKEAVFYAMVLPTTISITLGIVAMIATLLKLRNNRHLADYFNSGIDTTETITLACDTLGKRFFLH